MFRKMMPCKEPVKRVKQLTSVVVQVEVEDALVCGETFGMIFFLLPLPLPFHFGHCNLKLWMYRFCLLAILGVSPATFWLKSQDYITSLVTLRRSKTP